MKIIRCYEQLQGLGSAKKTVEKAGSFEDLKGARAILVAVVVKEKQVMAGIFKWGEAAG